MALTAEELLRKMFPVQSEELISLMSLEKFLVFRFKEISKEEKSLTDLILSSLNKENLTKYKDLQTEKLQTRKRLLQTRIQISNLTKVINNL
jgi:hypothetical protein